MARVRFVEPDDQFWLGVRNDLDAPLSDLFRLLGAEGRGRDLRRNPFKIFSNCREDLVGIQVSDNGQYRIRGGVKSAEELFGGAFIQRLNVGGPSDHRPAV